MTDSPDGPGAPPNGAGEPGAAADGPRRRARARRTGRSLTTTRGKRRLRRRHTVAKVITASLLALGTATAVSVVLVYNNWNGNLDYRNLDAQLGEDRPDKQEVEGPQEPLNILVMGSDTREGAGNNIDGLVEDSERSDTTIMLHLSADREFAYGISIPRDTLVDRPTCFDEDGNEIPGAQNAIWNEAFSVGGPACTIRQFEQLTDIRIDHYLVVDFQGFKDMVNALDGVEVCIPEDINDEEHGITLEAGTRELEGDEALSYVRVRAVGDGTDPNRIRRQQAFMAAMINKAVSAGMLVRPERLIGFLNAVTDSIQTDYENVGQMTDVARSFRSIGLDRIKFVTTPWVYSDIDPNRVEWTQQVEDLWQLVIDDQPLTAEFTEDSISAADEPDGSESPQPSGDGEGNRGGRGGGREDDGLSDEARENAGLCT